MKKLAYKNCFLVLDIDMNHIEYQLPKDASVCE